MLYYISITEIDNYIKGKKNEYNSKIIKYIEMLVSRKHLLNVFEYKWIKKNIDSITLKSNTNIKLLAFFSYKCIYLFEIFISVTKQLMHNRTQR